MGRALPPLIWTKSKRTAAFFSGNRPLQSDIDLDSIRNSCDVYLHRQHSESLFLFPHLLIIPRFLFILFPLFLCSATSAGEEHICLDCIFVFLYVGSSYFFHLLLSLLFLYVFLSFLIFSLFLAVCHISR